MYAVDVFEFENNTTKLEACRDVLTGQDVGNAATGIVADVGYYACDNLIWPVGDKQKLIPNWCKCCET